jgi:hypothetical protein
MAIRMAKLRRDPSSGSWFSRKEIPRDIRESYAAIYRITRRFSVRRQASLRGSPAICTQRWSCRREERKAIIHRIGTCIQASAGNVSGSGQGQLLCPAHSRRTSKSSPLRPSFGAVWCPPKPDARLNGRGFAALSDDEAQEWVTSRVATNRSAQTMLKVLHCIAEGCRPMGCEAAPRHTQPVRGLLDRCAEEATEPRDTGFHQC